MGRTRDPFYAHFGIGEYCVSQASRRVADKTEEGEKLKGKIAKIERKLNLSRMKTWPLCF